MVSESFLYSLFIIATSLTLHVLLAVPAAILPPAAQAQELKAGKFATKLLAEILSLNCLNPKRAVTGPLIEAGSSSGVSAAL